MNCPDCGYAMAAFDKSCPRCAQYAANGKRPPALLSGSTFSGPTAPGTIAEEMAGIPDVRPVAPSIADFACSRCGKPVVGGTRFCPHCGLAFAQEVPESRGFVPIVSGAIALPEPHIATVVAMWFLTVLAVLIGIGGAPGAGVLVDLFALGMGIRLVYSSCLSDKRHGKAKLVLESIAFVIGLFSALYATGVIGGSARNEIAVPTNSYVAPPSYDAPAVPPPVTVNQPSALKGEPSKSLPDATGFTMQTKAGGGPSPKLDFVPPK